MKISHSVELPDGSYKYQGTFEGPELDFLVEYAVNNLLKEGAFPFVHHTKMDESLSPYPDEVIEQ